MSEQIIQGDEDPTVTAARKAAWEAYVNSGDYQRVQDIAVLKDAGKDTVLVLTELIDWLLTNTALTATDFTPQVKQAYLDLKVIADRVKS